MMPRISIYLALHPLARDELSAWDDEYVVQSVFFKVVSKDTLSWEYSLKYPLKGAL